MLCIASAVLSFFVLEIERIQVVQYLFIENIFLECFNKYVKNLNINGSACFVVLFS